MGAYFKYAHMFLSVKLDSILNLTLMKTRLWGIDLQLFQWHTLYKGPESSYNFYNIQNCFRYLVFFFLFVFFCKDISSAELSYF